MCLGALTRLARTCPRALANCARRGTNVDQATPGDAGSRAENPRAGPTGRTRAGGSRAGMLAEPKGARARNAWGADRWPSPAGASRRPEPLQGSERSSFAPFVSLWNSEELGSPAGPSIGRARPAPAGGPNRTEGQNVQVSLRLSVGGTQDDLGPPAGPGRTPGRRFAPSTRRDILAISGSN